MKTYTSIADLKNEVAGMDATQLHKFFSGLGFFNDEEECFHGHVEINGRERFVEAWYSLINCKPICTVF